VPQFLSVVVSPTAGDAASGAFAGPPRGACLHPFMHVVPHLLDLGYQVGATGRGGALFSAALGGAWGGPPAVFRVPHLLDLGYQVLGWGTAGQRLSEALQSAGSSGSPGAHG
jgi:hypothetical protein